MNRRSDSRYPGRITLLAAAFAGALVAAPAAVAPAAEPAADEYTLEYPGSRDTGLGRPGAARGSEQLEPLEQAGVAGEAPPTTASPLHSLAAAAASPAGVALALLLFAGCATITAPRRRPPRAG